MKNYKIFTADGTKELTAETFNAALRFAVFNKSCRLVEYEGNKSTLYVWGKARLLDVKTFRLYFENDPHMMELLKQRRTEIQQIFVYIPYDFSCPNHDKRNIVTTEAYNNTKILSIEEVIKFLGGGHYAYGDYCALSSCPGHSFSLDKTVARAKQDGFGYAAVYLAEMARILIFWDAEFLNTEEVLQQFEDDKTLCEFVRLHSQTGYNDFVYASVTKRFENGIQISKDLFPLDFFEGAIYI